MKARPGPLKVTVTKAPAKPGRLRGSVTPPTQMRPEEVEIVDDHRTSPLGWRAKKSSVQPFSLFVPVTPTVLDVFTSSKGNVADRQRVFFLGDSMKWNVIHHVDPLLKQLSYEVTVHLQRIGLGGVADNEARIESVFPIET